MARLKGTQQLYSTVLQHQHEDGLVVIGSNGYDAVNALPPSSVFQSLVRTGVGVWTGTFKECYPCNLNYFHVDSQLPVGSTPPVLLTQLLTDTVGVPGYTDFNGGNPQTVEFMFVSLDGVPTDLPVGAGFKYEVGLQLSTLYYTESY